MRYGGAGETLVSGRLRVDAQRHLAAHQLVHYEFVQFFCFNQQKPPKINSQFFFTKYLMEDDLR